MSSPERTSTPGVFKRGARFSIAYRVNGKQVWETCGTSKRDAQREREERLSEVRAGTWKPAKERNRQTQAEPTLAEYVERWLARQDPGRTPEPTDGRVARRRIAPATFHTYSSDLRNHVLPKLGGKRLSEITTDDIDGLVHGLEDGGKASGGIRNVIVPLRRLLFEAVRQGLIPTNPASRADLPPAQDGIAKEVPPDHIEQIRWALALSAPFEKNGQDFLAVHMLDLALGLGLRFGELRALRWSDVDLGRQLVRVERAYSGMTLTRPKSEAGFRAVPIFDSVRQALVALSDRAIDYGRYGHNDEILTTARGKPIHPSNFNRRVWRPALKAIGLNYRWHDLRHSCVSRLVALGADVALVQAVAGHSDPRITLQRYTHLREARVTEAAERFSDAFGAQPFAMR